ncbi:MAG: hypothetical protein LBU86_02080 [Oscillospiraceae bacterium]|jgi:hypothetical protein|nr:hypothetical protein [Oscillospiraceae bacterium]
MKKTVIVLILIVICCSACSPLSSEISKDAFEITPSSSLQLNETNSAISFVSSLEATSDESDSSGTTDNQDITQDDTGIGDDTPATPDYHGFSQEQWNELQRQKAEYGDLSDEERGHAAFNGEIDCTDFSHLRWEHDIADVLYKHVGTDKFDLFLTTIGSSYDHCNIYSFAEHFSISLDELLSLIETNGLAHHYDLDTIKRRYTHLVGNSYATPDYHGFSQEQWNELQRQKAEYGDLSDEERGHATFNGEIDCTDFSHLWFEHQIDGPLIDFVGTDKFDLFLMSFGSSSDHCNIYSFAEYFSISFDKFVSLMESNPEVYDLETAKSRYKYLVGNR